MRFIFAKFGERGGWWVACQGVLMSAVFGLAWCGPGSWNLWTGLVIGGAAAVAGAVFGWTGARALGRNLTPFPKPAPSAQLVTDGIYARVRHPLYTSVILLSLGWACLWRSWPSLLAALAMIPFFIAKARREERWLREQYPDYAAYSQRTRRFIPGIY